MVSTRKDRLKYNTFSSLLLEIATIICGLILPKLIIQGYGSTVNGLVNSITQFLHIITFLDLGVGAVVQSSLYKPLADHDNQQLSAVVKSARKFFTRIACILAGYTVILCIAYPVLVNSSYDYIYTATLILAIGVSTFAQYYFGVVDRLLITADQHGYIQYCAQAATLLVNCAVSAVLIKLGASIQIVKFAASCIFFIRPVLIRMYVAKHYSIDRNISYSGEPIQQKWYGIAQHIASVVLEQTDVIVLTLLASLKDVSVYSVYNLVVYGVKNLLMSMRYGFQSLMGEYYAKNENEKLNELFEWAEWLIHTLTTFIFGCTGVLIIPFVMVYTKGITDAEYVVPLFAALITAAHACHCLRIPYHILILAAGHYKQTKNNYIIAAIMNITISAVTVKAFGLVGVAIGTLCAMLYQTVWMARYDSKMILKISMNGFYKHVFADVLTVCIGVFLTYKIPMHSVTYISWAIKSAVTAVIWIAAIIFVNTLLYKEKVKSLYLKMAKRFSGRS